MVSLPGGFSQWVLDEVLRETAEKFCKQIYSARIYYSNAGGLILFSDTIGRVNSGDNKTKVVHIPRQHRLHSVFADVHYFDVENRALMSTSFGRVSNGSILTFTVTRPTDVSYM